MTSVEQPARTLLKVIQTTFVDLIYEPLPIDNNVDA